MSAGNTLNYYQRRLPNPTVGESSCIIVRAIHVLPSYKGTYTSTDTVTYRRMICAKQKKKKIIDFLNNKYKTYVAYQCVINVRRRSINRGESEQIGQPRLTCYLVRNSKNVLFVVCHLHEKHVECLRILKSFFLNSKRTHQS